MSLDEQISNTRVYVRNRGYGILLCTYTDHAAEVGYEPASVHDGCDHPQAEGMERVPFGDWHYTPGSGPDDSAITAKYRMLSALNRSLGNDFHPHANGIGPGLSAWGEAFYGPFDVQITVKRREGAYQDLHGAGAVDDKAKTRRAVPGQDIEKLAKRVRKGKVNVRELTHNELSDLMGWAQAEQSGDNLYANCHAEMELRRPTFDEADPWAGFGGPDEAHQRQV